MAPDQAQPSALDDVRVLDLAGEMGLYCTKLLADLGADVIKIEPPAGEPARRVGPFYHDEIDPEKSLAFFNLNTSKRSITLNLDDEDGRHLLRRLIPSADVVVESFAPGYLDGLGLGYEGLCRIRPDIILTSLTGFGQWGPHAHYKSPDIVSVAMSGIMYLAGDPQDPPNRPYDNQAYISASIVAAAGSLIALYHRDLTGEGQQVDVSAQEALSIAQETAMQTWDMNKRLRSRLGLRGPLPIRPPGLGPYPCKDGFVFCYVGTPGGAPWTELLQWMADEGNAEDLTREPYAGLIAQLNMRFLTLLALDPKQVEQHFPDLQHIDEVLRRFLAAKTKMEAYEQGQGRRLLVGIVSTPKDLVENPQLQHRGYLQRVYHPELGDNLVYPGPPVRLSETPWAIRRRPPHIGQHNEEVYCGELGLSKEQLAALEAVGAV